MLLGSFFRGGPDLHTEGSYIEHAEIIYLHPEHCPKHSCFHHPGRRTHPPSIIYLPKFLRHSQIRSFTPVQILETPPKRRTVQQREPRNACHSTSTCVSWTRIARAQVASVGALGARSLGGSRRIGKGPEDVGRLVGGHSYWVAGHP